MSWQDRPYSGGDPHGGGFNLGGGLALPKWTPVVKWLIIINVVIFLLTLLCSMSALQVELPRWLNSSHYLQVEPNLLKDLGGLDVRLAVMHGQVWRFITTQYLHGGPMHLLFNMLGLFFLGPPLERQFGPRTFFWFYTFCGLVADVVFVLMASATGYQWMPIIGASGCVLGLLGGCAILVPRMIIILLFFPVPIRVAALLFVGIYVLNMLTAFTQSTAAGLSDAAHLGGMIGAGIWIMLGRRFAGRLIRGGGRESDGRRIRKSAGEWEKKQRKKRELAEEVDRILAKVHEKGINSLSGREKRILREATEQQQKDARDIDRKFRER